jgi:hypothetical protein
VARACDGLTGRWRWLCLLLRPLHATGTSTSGGHTESSPSSQPSSTAAAPSSADHPLEEGVPPAGAGAGGVQISAINTTTQLGPLKALAQAVEAVEAAAAVLPPPAEAGSPLMRGSAAAANVGEHRRPHRGPDSQSRRPIAAATAIAPATCATITSVHTGALKRARARALAVRSATLIQEEVFPALHAALILGLRPAAGSWLSWVCHPLALAPRRRINSSWPR